MTDLGTPHAYRAQLCSVPDRHARL